MTDFISPYEFGNPHRLHASWVDAFFTLLIFEEQEDGSVKLVIEKDAEEGYNEHTTIEEKFPMRLWDGRTL